MKRLMGALFVSALSLSLLAAGPAEAGRGYYHHHGGGGLSAGEAILGLGAIGLTAGAIAAIATAPPPPVYYPAPAYVYRPPVVYRPAPVYAPPPVVYYAPPSYPAPGVMEATPSSPTFAGPGGATCREFQGSGIINGRLQPIVGTACLQGDGSWRVVQ